MTTEERPMVTDTAPSLSTLLPRRAVFLAQWLKSPRRMASVTPSGRQLGRLMASAIPAGSRQVIELGAGTGAITEALLRHGVRPQNLLVIEMNPVLHELLQQRFPETRIACEDARHLRSLTQATPGFNSGQVEIICSSLGLLTMPTEWQHDILSSAFQVLGPDGVFVQYTYGRRPPLDQNVCDKLGLTHRCLGFAWRNLPPARVYAYTRQASAQPSNNTLTAGPRVASPFEF